MSPSWREQVLTGGGLVVFIVAVIAAMVVRPGPAEAERENIQRAWADTILESTVLSASTPVTSSAVPVGKAEDVAVGIQISGLGATDTVTLTTMALTNTNEDLAGYYVPIGVGAQRVITADEAKVYPIAFPAGVESLKFTVEAGPSGGATVKLVGCSQ